PECHQPAVLLPERFRGGCSFGAGAPQTPPVSSAGLLWTGRMIRGSAPESTNPPVKKGARSREQLTTRGQPDAWDPAYPVSGTRPPQRKHGLYPKARRDHLNATSALELLSLGCHTRFAIGAGCAAHASAGRGAEPMKITAIAAHYVRIPFDMGASKL